MAPKADIYLESISRNDKRINFHLALLSQICDNEFSTFEVHYKDILMDSFYINGNEVVSRPTNKGIALSLMPGTYHLKIGVTIDYEMDLSMINDYISGFSHTPDKRFKKRIVKELTVNINDTRDCYVGFTAYLHIEWNRELDINFGDYYNRELHLGMNWTIEHTKDDYHFVRTSKEALDKACCYWYRAEDEYEYGYADPELVNEYSNKYNMESTSSYTSNESTPKWYEYDVDDDYDGIDIEKELAMPKNAIKKTSSNTTNSDEYNKIIENISKRNVGSQPVVEKDPNEEIKNKLKKIHFDKYDTNGSEEFIKEFCKLNPYYAKLGYKSLNHDLKVWSKKWPESVTHHLDGSKFIGKHTSWSSVSKGTYFDINGEVYEGEWLGAYRHGKGKIIYPNGDVLECQYSDNKLHGKCILHKLDGEDIEQEYNNGILIDSSLGN